jgi:two-component system LytT family response regulator
VVEDEPLARARLAALLARVDPGARVVGEAASTEELGEWLASNDEPDLILADLRLEDGSSIDAFAARPVRCPVVFVTAYDDQWREALAAGAVDYLVKPVGEDSCGGRWRRSTGCASTSPAPRSDGPGG